MKTSRWQPFLPALALFTATGVAQMTGVSHPDDPEVTPPAAAQADHYVMPSHPAAAIPAPGLATPSSQGASLPANSTAAANSASQASGEPMAYAATGPVPAADPIPQVAPVAPSPSGLRVRQPSAETATPGYVSQREESAGLRPYTAENPGDDSGIVTSVPAGPFELAVGTLLKVRLAGELDTAATAVGSPFSAQLLADAGHDGRVLLPAGSILHGRITQAHGGRRFSGGAALHLEPETVTLPDGTSFPLQATLAEVAGPEAVRVNSEGTIHSKTDAKLAATVLGGSTAVGAVTGAVLGGGVGAVVGAGIGAGVSTVVWLKQDQQAALPTGATLFFSLDEPLQLSPR